MKKVVLAYSGGLDTSVILKWLIEKHRCEVIACCVDVGQNENFRELEKKAKKIGAKKVYIINAKEEFVKDFIFPALMANATYEGRYFLATALARPLIAKKVVEVAKKEKADTIAHGSTGKGNDQIRFELAFKFLLPNIKIVAPWREWDLKSRKDEIKYALKHGIPVGGEKKYSIDQNIWHTSHEGGELENIEKDFGSKIFDTITPYEKAPEKPTYVEISFEKGIPNGINGKKVEPVELIKKLNIVGARNGIGKTDMVEDRLIGIKSRGIYESPAATILYTAHRELESITLDRETLYFKYLVSQKYAELVYYGLWFSPLREAFDAFVSETQKYVTGRIKLKLYKGNIDVCRRISPFSLYRKEYSTFEFGKLSHKDATGFINIFGLPLNILAKVRKKK